MLLSFNYRPRFICKLMTHSRNFKYLTFPVEVLKCIKFPSLIALPSAWADEVFAMVTERVVHSVLDLVQGPSLVHYDSMRTLPSRRLLRVQNPDCYKIHSFIVSKTPQ